MEVEETDEGFVFIKTTKRNISPKNIAVRMSDVIEALTLLVPHTVDAKEVLKYLAEKAYEDNGI